MARGRVVVLSTPREEKYLLAVGVLKDAGVPFFAQASAGDGITVSPRLVSGSSKRREGGTYDVEVPALHAERAKALLAEHRLDLPDDEAPLKPEDVRFSRLLLGLLAVCFLLTVLAMIGLLNR